MNRMLHMVSNQPADIEKRRRANLKILQSERWKGLTKEPTVDLFRRIVEDADRSALKVFLSTRKLFRPNYEPPLLLTEFLAKLREKLLQQRHWEKNIHELADCVYDLTMAKYSNFPNSSSSDDYSLKATGVDCRKYYRAILSKLLKRKDEGRYSSQAEEEDDVAKVVLNMVYNNYFRSEQECKRHSLFSIRYTWEVDGIKLYIWYPSYMIAKKFKAWLEENIKDVNPKAPDEQKRIQSLIDKTFGCGYHISLDKPGVGSKLSVKEECSSIEFYDGLAFVGSLAETVAQEKVRNIHELRPAIRKLGGEKIERLILQIFADLTESEYDAGQIARKYGISKATFSRFSGSKWVEKIGDTDVVKIPDLWRNTAKILAGNRVFMETVLTSGFAGKLEEVLAIIESQEDEKNDR